MCIRAQLLNASKRVLFATFTTGTVPFEECFKSDYCFLKIVLECARSVRGVIQASKSEYETNKKYTYGYLGEVLP